MFPFGFLPFVPAQTTTHYAAHLVYAVLQLPLLVVARGGMSGLRRPAILDR